MLILVFNRFLSCTSGASRFIRQNKDGSFEYSLTDIPYAKITQSDIIVVVVLRKYLGANKVLLLLTLQTFNLPIKYKCR